MRYSLRLRGGRLDAFAEGEGATRVTYVACTRAARLTYLGKGFAGFVILYPDGSARVIAYQVDAANPAKGIRFL